ncbi:DNA-3-methyladenine glycosylase family protein [Haloferula sp.]|uniref:DNA-3-methyladenine glycosylase family protein n=1 Tax=Haloferula sp. TaxID=2497595 RepID=UPI003C7085C2
MRIIETLEDVHEGTKWLARKQPRFAHALKKAGALPLRRRKDGFEALLDAIVSQQVSVAAGDAIWKRLEASKLTGPRKISAASDQDLRTCGLSRQKIRYAKALADARIDYPALRKLSTEEVTSILTEVPGVGRWTAEIYSMFSLGHADAFAAGDLALQEATRILFELQDRPSEAALRAMARDWSPWRAVAARLLWHYYHVVKDRSGIR